jgi:cell division protein FtsW
MYGLQAIINIAVVSGIVPTKGIPLPFVSAGGSSLLFSMLGIGILVNIARQSAVLETSSSLMDKAEASEDKVDRRSPMRIWHKILTNIAGFSWR